MTTSYSKYPNADTSPERLAEIKGHLENYAFAEPDAHESIRDLLAMLQECDIANADSANARMQLESELRIVKSNYESAMRSVAAALDLKNKYYEQLHDQRWRRFSANAQPEINQPVEFIGADPEVVIPVRRFPDGSYVISGSDGLDCIRPHGDDWWRPIPPLPTE